MIVDPPLARPPPASLGPVAEAIRALRGALRCTQDDLAALLGVAGSTVQRWENGHMAPQGLARRALTKLARERGVPLRFLEREAG